jgi:hypothetical protein
MFLGLLSDCYRLPTSTGQVAFDYATTMPARQNRSSINFRWPEEAEAAA